MVADIVNGYKNTFTIISTSDNWLDVTYVHYSLYINDLANQFSKINIKSSFNKVDEYMKDDSKKLDVTYISSSLAEHIIGSGSFFEIFAQTWACYTFL